MNDTIVKSIFTREDLEQAQKEELVIQTVNNFVQLVLNLKSEKSLFEEQLKQKEGITNDFLHQLELCEIDEDEEKSLIEKQKINRRERRLIKDNLDIIEPIFKFISDPNVFKVLQNMTNLVGEIRRIRKIHENRVYVKRENNVNGINGI